MTTTTQRPRTEDIARQAYFLYEKRGCKPGHELDDWLAAETLLSSASHTDTARDTGHQITWQQPTKAAETRTAKRSK